MIVEKKYIELSKPFITESGYIFQKPIVAYEEYGITHGPVIMVCHGGLSSQHAAGKFSKEDKIAGWWDAVIGVNKAIDTNKFRVLSMNSLGSMYGTTSPLTTNPDTNLPFGKDFPNISMIDMVNFQKQFLDDMGVNNLFMITGCSMGSLISLQMAALYPDFINSVVAVATAGRMTPSGLAFHNFILNALKLDPNFNKGEYMPGEVKHSLRIIHQVMKIYYTDKLAIKSSCWDNVQEGPNSQDMRNSNCNNFLTEMLEETIENKDPNCYIRILNAINSYDLGRDQATYEQGVCRIKCPTLLINLTTDHEFDVSWAHEVANILNKNNSFQSKVIELDTIWGHMGCIYEAHEIDKHMLKFITTL